MLARRAARPAGAILHPMTDPMEPITPDALLARLADVLCRMAPGRFLRVAVDGVDGVGKTTLADRLGAAVEGLGRPVLRASADGFLNPRAVRYGLGRDSPEGFYRDTYDLAALRHHLLDPLAPCGSGLCRRAVFDHAADTSLPAEAVQAPPGAALVLDGMFLHRPELAGVWDLSIFLDAPFAVTIPRGAARGAGYGSPDPEAPANRRYVEGQRLYLAECTPQARADVVIDHRDLAAPRILAWRVRHRDAGASSQDPHAAPRADR